MNINIIKQFEKALSDTRVVQSGPKLDNACIDFFGHWQGSAAAILYPENTQEVCACLQICTQHNIAITVQGGKTGLVAGSVPSQTNSGVILSLIKFKRIREVDVPNRSVVVEAGVTIAELNEHLSNTSLHFPISIGSEGDCQIGGVISTNAGGHGVFRYGMTRNQLLGVEAVLPDGRLMSNLRALRKDNVGYDFAQLLCGAEGTLGVITAAALKVLPLPRTRVTAFLAIQNIDSVIDLYTTLSTELSDFLCAFELIPAAGRTMVEKYIKEGAPPPIENADWYVLLQAESTAVGLALETLVSQSLAPYSDSSRIVDAVIAQSEAQRAQMWKFREALVFAQGKHGPILSHDLSVRVSKIPELIRRGQKVVSEICPDVSFINFGHVGDGNLHFNIVHNGADDTFKQTYRIAVEKALCEVVETLGGSISAEHGIGRKKRQLVHYSRDDIFIDIMKSTRRAIDPNLVLNADVLF